MLFQLLAALLKVQSFGSSFSLDSLVTPRSLILGHVIRLFAEDGSLPGRLTETCISVAQ